MNKNEICSNRVSTKTELASGRIKDRSDQLPAGRRIGTSRICICCGERMGEQAKLSRNPNVCSSCSSLADGIDEEEYTESDSEAELLWLVHPNLSSVRDEALQRLRPK